eukprot:3696559-Amphidinium_carterae.1
MEAFWHGYLCPLDKLTQLLHMGSEQDSLSALRFCTLPTVSLNGKPSQPNAQTRSEKRYGAPNLHRALLFNSGAASPQFPVKLSYLYNDA